MDKFKTRAELDQDLEDIKKDLEDIKDREEAIANEVEEAKEEETLDSLEEELEKLKSKKSGLEKEKSKVEAKIAEIEEKNKTKEKERGDENMKTELRAAVDNFIRTRGEQRAGLKTDDVGVVIPNEVIYNPQEEVKTVVDLSKFVDKQSVTTASGKYPILKKATETLKTVAELEANPELAKPEFINVDWSVKTYRGNIPISQEAIADSSVDLIALVGRNAEEQKLNTSNAKIIEATKTFDAKTVSDADGLKDIVNVDIDPAYNKRIIASQTFFNELDKLKDKNGRYLLQDNIQSSSGKGILGLPIEVVSDSLFGEAGTAQAFVGDLKRAVFMADRADLSVEWLNHEIYGKYLGVYTRFDVVAADKDAGFLVTFENAPEA